MEWTVYDIYIYIDLPFDVWNPVATTTPLQMGVSKRTTAEPADSSEDLNTVFPIEDSAIESTTASGANACLLTGIAIRNKYPFNNTHSEK